MTTSSIEPGNMDEIENTNGHSMNPKPKKIALIICSTRTKRIGPQLASWLCTHLPTPPDQSITLQTIDLAQYLPSLPLSPNNSVLPYYVLTPLGENPYEEEGTNAWSRVVRGFDGFVWLTPEYNWCFPAAVKIAVDLLFHEWKGKPALVVSYGNEGGGKAGQALRGVLECVRCHPWREKVELSLGYGESIERAVKGELMGSVVEGWEKAGKGMEIRKIWRDMLELVTREWRDVGRFAGNKQAVKGGPLVRYDSDERINAELQTYEVIGDIVSNS